MKEFRVVDISFPIPANTTGDQLFESLERDLPDRVWLDQHIAPSWNERTRVFEITVFESGFEDRAAIQRWITDKGLVATEQENWL